MWNVSLLKTENKMICKFLAFYKKTFYSESMIVLYDPVSMQTWFLFGFLSFLSWGSISCLPNWLGNMNFKMKKYQWKPTNCCEFDAYKYRLAATLFVSGQIYNFRTRMKKIFMDYENS